MVKLFLLIFDELSSLDSQISSLSPAVREKIEETKDEELKKERIVTYTFLEKTVEKYKRELCRASGKRFFSENFRLEVDFKENGKPFIKGIDCDISVSHTKKMAFVAISFVKFLRIGADVEKHTERSIKAAQTFLNSRLKGENISLMNLKKVKEIGELEFYILSDGKFYEESVDIEDEPEDIGYKDIDKWCAIEALLKLDGGGFRSIGKIGAIINGSDCYVLNAKLGEDRFSIAFAIEKLTLNEQI